MVRTAARNVVAAGGPAAVLSTGGADAGDGSSGGEGQQLGELPPPMIPGNADQATTLCAMQVGCSCLRCGGGGSVAAGVPAGRC